MKRLVNIPQGLPPLDRSHELANPLVAFFFHQTALFCGQSLLVAAVMWHDAITPEGINAIDKYHGQKSQNNPDYPLCKKNRIIWNIQQNKENHVVPQVCHLSQVLCQLSHVMNPELGTGEETVE